MLHATAHYPSVNSVKSANLAVRLLLEVASLAALGYWGWVTAETVTLQVIQVAVAPALFAVAWGLVISPKAPRRLSDPVRLLVEIGLFALVAGALAGAGQPALALIFAVAVGVHLVLMVRWRQRGM